MAFVPQIPDWFDTRKAAQVTAWFTLKAGGKINILLATKLIYLSDRLSMEERDAPITGDNFVSMPFGPVNTYTYSYMNGEAPVRQDQWGEFIARRKGYDLLLANDKISEDSLDELSKAEVDVLTRVFERFKDIDQFDLADWTHKFCPEWRDPNGSSIPIDFATVFAKLNKDDPVDLAEEIQAERALSVNVRSG